MIWQIDPLTVGATRTLTVTAVAPTISIGIPLITTANINMPTQDPNVNNNTQAWWTWPGNRSNLLNLTNKAVTTVDVVRGNIATYTVRIMNSGTLSAAVTITDPLPMGVSYQASSSTIDGVPIDLYQAASNQIEWAGPIGPAQTIELQFRVKAIAFGGDSHQHRRHRRRRGRCHRTLGAPGAAPWLVPAAHPQVSCGDFAASKDSDSMVNIVIAPDNYTRDRAALQGVFVLIDGVL